MAKIAGEEIARPKGKRWAWSYSKLKNYETCPKRHYEVDLAKNYIEKVDPDGPLAWGNRVHDALAAVLKGVAPLPEEMEIYQDWVRRVQAGTGKLMIEQKFAITDQFQPCAYFAPDCWYRGIGDVVRLDEEFAMVLDWKTGKILEDSVQLMLMAQCIFAHFPKVQWVRSAFIWLKDDCQSPEMFTRQEVADQWIGLLERVHAMEQAHIQQAYPPKPGRLCKSYCPVTSCIHHGKGR
jgi:hypothetical protein